MLMKFLRDGQTGLPVVKEGAVGSSIYLGTRIRAKEFCIKPACYYLIIIGIETT
jgi:hypothetical protein